MPLPTGVVNGPLMATRLRRIESSTCAGMGSPYCSITPSPASCTSHSMSTPVASMTRRAAALTSGPTPSPGISVIVCRAIVRPPPARMRRPTEFHMWTQGLKAWYAERGRHELPWRQTRDPWAVLVSEVMLQQTQVSRVLPRFAPFLDRWPAPAALAATPLPDVLREWRGMGYPRRARDLHRTATLIAAGG